jgi:hypothetical protein
MGELVPLSELSLDLAVPATGWAAELSRRGIETVVDDIGRPAIARSDARDLLTERREQQEAAARHREQVEQRAIEADRLFRQQLPPGVPAGAVPPGVTAGLLMMLSDPANQGSRRESVLEHSLAHPAGEILFHPIGGEA